MSFVGDPCLIWPFAAPINTFPGVVVLVADLIRLSALFLFLCCPIFHEHISIVIFLQHVTWYVKLLGDIDRISFITFGTQTFSLLLRDFINSRHIPQVSVRLHLFLFAGERYWDTSVAVRPRLYF